MIDESKILEAMAKELARTYYEEHASCMDNSKELYIERKWDAFKVDAKAALAALIKELPKITGHQEHPYGGHYITNADELYNSLIAIGDKQGD